MIIEKLKLKNFRNLKDIELYFSKSMNIIIGLNGQGKTNLLESIFLLSTTSSFRINDEKKCIHYDESFARIDCTYNDNISHQMGFVLHQKGKNLFYDGEPILKSSNFIGLLNVILFSPSDIHIFETSPKNRRKLVDVEITKVNKKYLNALVNYQKVLKERNLLLKSKKDDPVYHDILISKMVEYQNIILKFRNHFVQFMNEILTYYYQLLSGQQNKIQMIYESCVLINENSENLLKEMLENAFEKDKILQITTCGIHRDDFYFKMDDKNVNDIASQGQRRLVMLSFKLGLIHYIEKMIHKKPILLLDDIFSELDIEKQQNLLNCISDDIQTIITTCTSDLFLKKDHKVIKIKDGKLMEDIK